MEGQAGKCPGGQQVALRPPLPEELPERGDLAGDQAVSLGFSEVLAWKERKVMSWMEKGLVPNLPGLQPLLDSSASPGCLSCLSNAFLLLTTRMSRKDEKGHIINAGGG